jgi:hypothetical protein
MGRAGTFAVVLACMLGLAAYYAIVTRLAFAGSARGLLSVHFASVPDRPSQAVAIWLHNSRVVLGVAAWVAGRWGVRALTSDGLRGAERIPLWIADGILFTWATGMSFAAGVLIGAYGTRQLRVFWPYAPVEVAAWALMLAVYIGVRCGSGAWRQTVGGLVMVELLLALAAVLEVLGGRL